MNRFIHNFSFRAILLLIIALNVYSKLNKNNFGVYFIIILILSEIFKYTLFIKKIYILKDKTYLSKALEFILIILSCVALGFLSYYYSNFIIVYMFLILFECFRFKGIFKILLSIVNYLTYITPLILSHIYLTNYIFDYKIINKNLYLFIIQNSIIYFGYFIIIVLIRKVKKNKKNIYTLNEELKEQNLKLKEYSEKIEELTLSKERNRVAQELHDSLGHYLMAISMHLDVLDKTLDTSPSKSKNILSKTKVIVDDSIKELRSTVYSLKKNDINILSSINSLIKNLSVENNVSFEVNISKDIEGVSLLIKDNIYKTIKEALTNGLKHGHASIFNINCFIENKNIYLFILNNGIKPSKIIKSNGLIGMEDRIKNLNGSLNIENTSDGFKISVQIPLYT